MSDTMMQMSARNFMIPKLSKLMAMKAVKGLIGHTETINDEEGAHWIGVYPSDVSRSSTFEQVLEAWNWKATVDGQGNISDLSYKGSNRGDEELLFHTIAFAVVTGSYLKFLINGTRVLTYRFESGRCIHNIE